MKTAVISAMIAAAALVALRVYDDELGRQVALVILTGEIGR